MPNQIGQNIKRAREAKGWNQVTLAQHALGAASKQHQLSRWESGEHMPTIPSLQRLASALSLSVADLLDDTYCKSEQKLTPAGVRGSESN